MQYDYAEEAMHEGEYELATLHINEAKKRLDGVKEWQPSCRFARE